MKTLAYRLKLALDALGISQTEAARRCSISQQSINYIISRDVLSSKLAPKIATSLELNPDWLIYGEGKMQEEKIYEIPVLKNYIELFRFLHNDLELKLISHIFIERDLGEHSFGYTFTPNKLAICYKNTTEHFNNLGFLSFKENTANFSHNFEENSFSIFEWRERAIEF